MSAPPPQVTLPEAFVLLSHLDSGEVHDLSQTAAGCAAAELGELALRRRLRVVPRKKRRVLGFEVYSEPGEIRLLDTAPTGLDWADRLLEKLELHAAPDGGAIRVHEWLQLRSREGVFLHRDVLSERGVLRHVPGGRVTRQRHYPDAALRDALLSRLRAVNSGLIPLDEHTLLLLDLLERAELDLKLTLSMRQRLDRARGVGAVAALPEDMRDTSTVLRMSVPSRSRGGDGGGGDGGDGGGE
ncbi:GPP34 family phosphoprotein [Streptomyces iconiensis]|uniref:GPP34 family phosphoprotein n=1 Tax=Streptomyces iconiensis TaxID=1384038 RepID=A0ABT6ZXW3_9ACTN|nr:GPP34 family phosphoprotein [Streptomyces iconiensis]MDJ1133908.1 GPP34 family phosphoprotein [Streptomyces iconiensis]